MKLLNVDTVSRIIGLYESSGDIAPKQYLPNSGTSALIEVDKVVILEFVIDKPGMHVYHIVPGKCPRVLAAQAPKIEGGWLHGEVFEWWGSLVQLVFCCYMPSSNSNST